MARKPDVRSLATARTGLGAPVAVVVGSGMTLAADMRPCYRPRTTIDEVAAMDGESTGQVSVIPSRESRHQSIVGGVLK
jgi:hypothetical protein